MSVGELEEVVSTVDLARRFKASRSAVVAVVDRLGLGRRLGRNRVIPATAADLIGICLKAGGYTDQVETIGAEHQAG